MKLIDIVTVRLDTATDSYIAALPSLRLTDARIDGELRKVASERGQLPSVVDRAELLPLAALAETSVVAIDGKAIMERARAIK